MIVTRTFTRKPGQNKRRYPNEIEVIEVSEAQIDAALLDYPAGSEVTRATAACHVARMTGLVHAGGRRCVTTAKLYL